MKRLNARTKEGAVDVGELGGGRKKAKDKEEIQRAVGVDHHCPMPPIYQNCCSYVHTLSYQAVSTEHENTAAFSLTKSPPLQPEPLG